MIGLISLSSSLLFRLLWSFLHFEKKSASKTVSTWWLTQYINFPCDTFHLKCWQTYKYFKRVRCPFDGMQSARYQIIQLILVHGQLVIKSLSLQIELDHKSKLNNSYQILNLRQYLMIRYLSKFIQPTNLSFFMCFFYEWCIWWNDLAS